MPTTPLTIKGFKIYNRYGYQYELDIHTRRVYSNNHRSLIYSDDDRLWPIYHRYNQNTKQIMWAEEYPIVGRIPYYFKFKDGKIHILRVKNAIVYDEVYGTRQRNVEFLNNINIMQRNNEMVNNNVFYPLVLDGHQLYMLERPNNFGVQMNTPMKLQYVFNGKNCFLGKKTEEKNADNVFIEPYKMYPLIIKIPGKGFEHKKMEMNVETERDWFQFGKLLNAFIDDALYFQVDDNGIMQTFYCKPTKSEPDTAKFTGKAYDLSFNPPVEIHT